MLRRGDDVHRLHLARGAVGDERPSNCCFEPAMADVVLHCPRPACMPGDWGRPSPAASILLALSSHLPPGTCQLEHANIQAGALSPRAPSNTVDPCSPCQQPGTDTPASKALPDPCGPVSTILVPLPPPTKVKPSLLSEYQACFISSHRHLNLTRRTETTRYASFGHANTKRHLAGQPGQPRSCPPGLNRHV